MWAPACWAIASWLAGGITLSAVPMMAQDGIVFQAGTPDTSVSAVVESGRCVAASAAPSLAGSPLVKQPGNTSCFTYASTTPVGAPGNGTKLKTVVGSATAKHEPAPMRLWIVCP